MRLLALLTLAAAATAAPLLEDRGHYGAHGVGLHALFDKRDTPASTVAKREPPQEMEKNKLDALLAKPPKWMYDCLAAMGEGDVDVANFLAVTGVVVPVPLWLKNCWAQAEKDGFVNPDGSDTRPACKPVVSTLPAPVEPVEDNKAGPAPAN